MKAHTGLPDGMTAEEWVIGIITSDIENNGRLAAAMQHHRQAIVVRRHPKGFIGGVVALFRRAIGVVRHAMCCTCCCRRCSRGRHIEGRE